MVKLKFQTDFGFRFELDVSRNNTLEEIKLEMNKIYGFPISGTTLSFNGIIIASTTHLLAAPLIDGSEIRLDIVDEAPTEPPSTVISEPASSSAQTAHRGKRGRLNSGASSSHAIAEYDAPKKVSITLKLPEPFGAVNHEATDDETILKLKRWIRRTQQIPIDVILIKDESGKELLDDAKTLLQCQIADKSELAVEFLVPSLTSLLHYRVVLKYGSERESVEVEREGKVSQLRTMLEENQVAIKAELPNPYFFIHNQDAIDENLTFLSQNVAEGDIIEIFSGRVAGPMTLKLETNMPHRKPFFYVRTHSDDTIGQLKAKIARSERIPVHRMVIKKNGIVQLDQSTLHACSITSDYGILVEILQ